MTPSLFHPFLLALFLAVSAYGEVRPLGNPWEAAALAPIMLLLAWSLMSGFRRILKDADKAALLASLLLFTAFLTGGIQNAVKAVSESQAIQALAKGPAIPVLLVVLTVLFAAIMIRTKRNLAALNQAVTIGVLSLLAITMGSMLTDRRGAIWRENVKRPPVRLEVPARPPDIYYFVLDCYASLDSLREFWNYDSAEFVAFLRKNNFLVNPSAKTEFRQTLYCLSSRLNMVYPPAKFANWDSRYNRNTMACIIEQSAGPALLEAAGYRIVNLSMTPVGSEPGRYPLEFNLCFSSVSQMLLERSILKRLRVTFTQRVKKEGPKILADSRSRLFHDLEALTNEKPGKPRFVLAHVMMTHPPFVFNRDGSLHDLAHEKDPHSNTFYLDQLIYSTGLLTNAISRILETSSTPPVIIIQGDHGYRGMMNLGKNQTRQASSILSALLLPGAPADDAQLDIRPVNTLRLVFNHTFNAGLPFVTNDPPTVITRKMTRKPKP